jgi:hypothetical protein
MEVRREKGGNYSPNYNKRTINMFTDVGPYAANYMLLE